jgi:hypothetical protein
MRSFICDCLLCTIYLTLLELVKNAPKSSGNLTWYQ